jgi:protein-S-isoprenylcysteine O-methyltransferase Ste14
MGTLFLYPALGIGILGLAGWGGWGFPAGIRIGCGLPPLITGLVFFLWAQRALGFRALMGGEGDLVVSGPFQFSRNPQYLGCLLLLTGWTLCSSSAAAAVASAFGFIPLLLVPFAEEPWLRARHGRAYDIYMKQVPRFLAIRLIQRPS